MKRILITGTNGFLGVRLMNHFKSRYTVYTPSHRELDVTDAEGTMRLFEKLHPHVVIHCAAISNTQLCENEKELSYHVNVMGALHIANSCKAIGAKMLFCSSDQLYNGETNELHPHKEQDRVTPQGVYANHKLEAEQLIQQNAPDAVCMRLSWMYDTHTVLTHEHSDLYRNIEVALQTKTVLSFPTHDYRGITPAKEIILAVEQALDIPGGVYNFGCTNDCSTYETLMKLFTYWHIPTSLLKPNEELFAQNPRNLCMNVDKSNSVGIYFSDTLEALKMNPRIALT